MATGSIQSTALPPAPPVPTESIERERLIQRQLARASGHMRLVDLASGMLLWLTGVLLLFILAAVADHLIGLGMVGRSVMLTVLVAASLWYLMLHVAPLLVRAINPAYAAKTIEEATPSLKNSLINFLLLRQDRSGVREIVYQAVEKQAAVDIAGVPVETTIDRTRLIHAGYFLCGVMAVLAAYKILSPKDPFQTVARVLAPWADIARPSRVEILDVEPGSSDVYYGQSVAISATIRGLRAKDQVNVVFSTADAQVIDQPLAMQHSAGDRYECTLPPPQAGASPFPAGLQQTTTYRIVAGDAESPLYRLNVISAPTIIVERLEYQYPAYTKKPPEVVLQQGDIKALEGTKVKVHALANQPIRAAWLEMDPVASEGAAELVNLTAEGDRANGTLTLLLKADRLTPWRSTYQVRFHNQRAEKSQQPIVHKIEVIRDLPPEVQIIEPERLKVEVPEDGELPIEVRAVDPDFGLSVLRIEGVTAAKQAVRIDLLQDAANHPPKAAATYRLRPREHQLKAGDELTYAAVAEDNRVNPQSGQPEPNVTRTKEYTLVVLPPQNKSGEQAKQANDGQKGQGKEAPPQNGKQQSKQSDRKTDERQPKQPKGAKGDEKRPDQQPQDTQPQDKQDKSQQQSGQQQQQDGQKQDGQKQDGQKQGGQKQDGQKQDGQKQDGQKQDGQKQDGQKQDGQKQDGQEQRQEGQQEQHGDQQSGQQSGQQSQDSQQQSGSDAQQQSGSGQQSSGQQSSGQQDQQQGGGQGASTGQKSDQATVQRSGDPSSGSQGGGQSQAGNQQAGGDDQGKAEHDGQAIERLMEELKRRGEAGGQEGDGQKTGNQGEQNQTGQQPGSQAQSKGASGNQNSGTPQSGRPEASDQQPGQNDASQPGQQNQPGQQKGTDPPDRLPGEKQGDSPAQQPGSGSKGGIPQGPTKADQAENDQGEKSSGSKGEKRGAGAGKQGEAGAGEKASDKTGSGPGAQKNADRPKEQQADDAASEKGETSAVSDSKRQSDSKGGESGDRSGGGKQGAGQSASQEGNDSAGSKSAADQGAGKAQESGSGETGSKAGEGQQAAGKTGQAGDQKGAGSGQKAGGDKSGDSAQEQPGEGTSGKSNDANRRSQKGGNTSGSDPVGGSDDGRERTPPPATNAEDQAADAANLEYARKATEMVLRRLKEEEHNPDPELLEKLGWTRDDLAEFLRRWEALQKTAAEAPTGQRELDEALKSLGLRDPANRRRAGGTVSDKQRDLRDAGNRSIAPPRYRDLFDAFRKGAARTQD